ncbi:MAG TPA: cytochrome c [Methylomirabilota bacterium]|nr:cytochrome c [Methylomirabilota bacterium]
MSADPGDADAGRAIFVEKQCARCHVPDGQRGAGPALEELRWPQGEMELAGRLWNHVPTMAQALSEAGFEWPKLTEAEMANLMAYLGAAPRRDPEPNLHRGQLILLRKGCLKCHSLRQEGGRVKPDLAERRADYDSGPAWAATMWAHTPTMAQMSSRLGIAYPRFAGDEMGNLVGFLSTPPRAARFAPGRRGARRRGNG